MHYLEMHNKVFTDDSWDFLGNTIAKKKKNKLVVRQSKKDKLLRVLKDTQWWL